MDKQVMAESQNWVKEELFDRCLPFWMNNGLDRIYGGILTYLDREGQVYSPDKSVWFQGRSAWIFAKLCNVYGVRGEWLLAAQSCLDFMEAHCFVPSGEGRMYFSVTREGLPLRLRRYYFSELFYSIACAEMYGVTGDYSYLEKSRKVFSLAWRLYTGQTEDIAGLPAKTNPCTRRSISLSEPLIFLNAAGLLRRFDKEDLAKADLISKQVASTIIEKHYHPDLSFVFENVSPEGEVLRHFPMGRVMNPGHAIEAAWFLMEEARYQKDMTIKNAAIGIYESALASGWDPEFGGLLSFVDIDGWPPEQIEHELKYWWPHTELLIASLKIACETGEGLYLEHFHNTLVYCRTHFSDPLFGEWFGYLRRDGTPIKPVQKGNLFKGPFHLPRALIEIDLLLGKLLDPDDGYCANMFFDN